MDRTYLTSSSCQQELHSAGSVGFVCDRACWSGKYFYPFKAITNLGDTIEIGYKDQKSKRYFASKWFAGCPPCLAEIPAIMDLQSIHTNISFVSICRDDVRQESDVINNHSYFVEHWIIDPVVQDSIFGRCGYPTSFIFDSSGKIDTAFGHLSYELNFENISQFIADL